MGNKIQLEKKGMRTLEVHTAVDIHALLIVSRGQCPNKGVVVLH